jgi:cytochrome c oxidase subunit 1
MPQFVMGAQDMPRRSATYQNLPQFYPYHVVSSVGAFIQLAGFVLAAVTLLYSLYQGKKAPGNPWGSATLEWTCSSPPPLENFKTTPAVGDPYDYSHLIWNEQVQGYVRDEED